MKNILIISGSYPKIKCGVGDYTNVLYSYLNNEVINQNYNFEILTSNKALNYNNPKIHNIVKKWSGFYIIRTILKFAKNYDIVHFEFPTVEYNSKSFAFYVLLPLLLRLKKIKVVYTFHEYSNNSRISKLVRIPAIKCSNKLIMVDMQFYNEINNKFKCQNKLYYIPIGSNIEKSTISISEIKEKRNEILNKYKVTKIISYFGFIDESKCMYETLLSFGKLKEEGKLDSMLLIIGEFNQNKCNKEYYNLLVECIEKYNLKENILVTGYLESREVGNYFKISDAAILLYKNGISLRNGSMLAAYQENIPIITSKNSQDNEFFKQKNFVLINNDITSICNAILDLQEGKIIPCENNTLISWEKIAQEHIKVYESFENKN